jgi:DMSO/TMAO reductase YedYZ molybdopterin-dependent catalytic subunit
VTVDVDVDDGAVANSISMEELQLATRNHGMPLEALRYPVTPVGLHYLLIHYDIPLIESDTWRLRVGGLVDEPLSLSLDDLRAMPATTRAATMECAGNGRALLEPRPASQPWLVEAVGTGEWTGVELAHVLAMAGVDDRAVEVLFAGADRGIEGGVEQSYERSLSVADATSSGALLAYELNGTPLPPQHGFPLRLVVPCWYGMTNVKWLTDITVLETPFTGYQQSISYRLKHGESDDGVPLTRMVPRSLMVPPGVPDFFTRTRSMAAGECLLTGRAWSGEGPIAAVEVSTDDGATWVEAELDDAPATSGVWRGWRHRWDAVPGSHVLCSRAADAAGNRQPTLPEWNLGGYVNNAVQRVRVEVQ